MSDAPQRPCSRAQQGCPNLTVDRFCADCAKLQERRRGSSAARGYGAAWRAFRERFRQLLIGAGILPVCGARMPGAPATTDSACKAAGRLNDRRLHYDHSPPLTDAERRDERAVCDPMRIQLLCEACHNAKTQREGQTTGG